MKPTKEYNGRSRIRMYNCDCMDFMEDCDTYDLAIVDPPYGIGADKAMGYKNNRENKDKWKGGEWDVKPNKEYFDLLKSVSENQIVWGGNYFPELWNKQARGVIIWDKVNRTCFGDGEMAWSSFDKPIRIYEFSSSNLQGFRNPDRFHPTEKPIQLYKWLLTNYANEGDTIFDSHGGSMSIAIACWDLGFDLDICELDTDYFNDAVKRFETHIAQTQLF